MPAPFHQAGLPKALTLFPRDLMSKRGWDGGAPRESLFFWMGLASLLPTLASRVARTPWPVDAEAKRKKCQGTPRAEGPTWLRPEPESSAQVAELNKGTRPSNPALTETSGQSLATCGYLSRKSGVQEPQEPGCATMWMLTALARLALGRSAHRSRGSLWTPPLAPPSRPRE